MNLEFTVFGKPETAGSKRAFTLPGKGSGKPRAHVVDANPKTKNWQGQVATAAKQYWPGPLTTGPVFVKTQFYFVRPKGHYGTGRNAGKLKPSAPHNMLKTPDVDKLERAVLDALKGVLYVDDKQVFRVRKFKRYGDYGEPPGVSIHIVARPEPVTHADLKQWKGEPQ